MPFNITSMTRPLRTDASVLLHPNIPRGMSWLNPRSVLGQEWWDTERHLAEQMNNYCCLACGVHRSDAMVHQWIEGHEQYTFDYKIRQAVYVGTIPLCHCCHMFIHCGRMFSLLSAAKIKDEYYIVVMRHGLSVLHAAGLQPTINQVMHMVSASRFEYLGEEVRKLLDTLPTELLLEGTRASLHVLSTDEIKERELPWTLVVNGSEYDHSHVIRNMENRNE